MAMDERRRQAQLNRVVKYAVWLAAVPIVLLVVLAVLGALHGATEQDCRAGFYTACGPGMKAAAYAVFYGAPILAAYYFVLALIGLLRFIGWALGTRSDGMNR